MNSVHCGYLPLCFSVVVQRNSSRFLFQSIYTHNLYFVAIIDGIAHDFEIFFLVCYARNIPIIQSHILRGVRTMIKYINIYYVFYIILYVYIFHYILYTIYNI